MSSYSFSYQVVDNIDRLFRYCDSIVEGHNELCKAFSRLKKEHRDDIQDLKNEIAVLRAEIKTLREHQQVDNKGSDKIQNEQTKDVSSESLQTKEQGRANECLSQPSENKQDGPTELAPAPSHKYQTNECPAGVNPPRMQNQRTNILHS